MITSEGYKAELEFEQTKVSGCFPSAASKEYAELEVTHLDLDPMVARVTRHVLERQTATRIDTTSNNVNKQLR